MGSLHPRAGHERAPDLESWRPLLLSRAAIDPLLASGRVFAVHDTLLEQLEELIETRTAHRKLSPAEKRALAEAYPGGPLEEYGTWVFYPWSGKLVHVLPEPELRELRTSRNRNKITAAEQERLRGARVGVAGLSVGQATALTVALEEVAGELRLADFDRLSLSNLNRLRAPIESIGVNKAVLTAREIFGFNPYANVKLFPEGIREESLDEFLIGEAKLSILFEECDDLRMKVRLRERARELRIPVLMETSDRGLFDVERFDEEPDRPIFHGLTGALRAEELDGMGSYEKVPVVLKIIGAGTMSKRMAASLLDIDATLRTWPQLASAVALGGAINTDVARRILLGQHHGSGRFYVDLERAIAPGQGSFETAIREHPGSDSIERPTLELPPIAPARWPPTRDEVRTLVAYATLAPSGGNVQPWRFEYRGATLFCFFDRERARSFLDFRERASALAFGALAENLALTARRMGLEAEIAAFPDRERPDLFFTARLAPREPASPHPDDELARMVPLRLTNRRRAASAPLSDREREELEAIAEAAGVELALLSDAGARDAAGAIVASAERIRLLSDRMHREMMSEIRWSPEEAARTRDGLDLETLELDPTERAGMQILSQWPIMRTIDRVGGGAGLEKAARKTIAAACAVGLVSVRGTSLPEFFAAGRGIERLWLTATARGLGFQPMTAAVYMFAQLEEAPGGFSDAARDELLALRARWRAIFPGAGAGEAMFFRLVRAGAPHARSLRRRVEDVLSFPR